MENYREEDGMTGYDVRDNIMHYQFINQSMYMYVTKPEKIIGRFKRQMTKESLLIFTK